MRYLVISDIHADIAALDVVLDHAGRREWDRVIFLGDAIGYGTEPEAVVQRLLEIKPLVALKGNHELAALPPARDPGRRRHEHAGLLSKESLSYLASLPERHVDASWAAVHGSPRDPMEYLVSIPAARANLRYMERSICLVGHTHVASAFIHDPEGETRPWRAHAFQQPESRLEIPERASAFLNPGSVSKPRDGLPRAAYAIFDDERRVIEVFRI